MTDFTKHWQAPKKPPQKKSKRLDAPNIDRHQKNQKKQKIQQLLRSGPIVPGNFSFFVFFGACARLVHLVVCFIFVFLVPVQVWWLWLHKTLTGTKKKSKRLDAPNIDRHQKIQKKQKIQQLLRSGPIVPGNFIFFCFFWCLCNFGASSGLFFFWCLCRFGDSDLTKHWQAPEKPKTPNH